MNSPLPWLRATVLGLHEEAVHAKSITFEVPGWRGVTIDDLFEAAGVAELPTRFVMAHCDGGYSTNYEITDLIDRRAMIATHFEGAPIPASHGGPARMLVPHLYFWKSAKWVRRLAFKEQDSPGFWESLGYHIRGDPWREQRYAGDE